jgi:hypothetical protein
LLCITQLAGLSPTNSKFLSISFPTLQLAGSGSLSSLVFCVSERRSAGNCRFNNNNNNHNNLNLALNPLGATDDLEPLEPLEALSTGWMMMMMMLLMVGERLVRQQC